MIREKVKMRSIAKGRQSFTPKVVNQDGFLQASMVIPMLLRKLDYWTDKMGLVIDSKGPKLKLVVNFVEHSQLRLLKEYGIQSLVPLHCKVVAWRYLRLKMNSTLLKSELSDAHLSVLKNAVERVVMDTEEAWEKLRVVKIAKIGLLTHRTKHCLLLPIKLLQDKKV